MKKACFLLLLLQIVALCSRSVILEGINRPDAVLFAAERIYVVEKSSVFIVDTRNGRVLDRFCRAGEGPGELMIDPGKRDVQVQIFSVCNEVHIYNAGRLIRFDADGRLIDERRLPKVFLKVLPLAVGFVSYGIDANDSPQPEFTVRLWRDVNGMGTPLYSRALNNPSGPRKEKENRLLFFHFPELQLQSDGRRIFLLADSKARIRCFDVSGKDLPDLWIPDCQPVAVPDEVIAEWQTVLRRKAGEDRWPALKKRLDFASHYPALSRIVVDGNNLWAETRDHTDEGVMFFRLDLSSAATSWRRHRLPLFRDESGDTGFYGFCNGKLVQVHADNGETYWLLDDYGLEEFTG